MKRLTKQLKALADGTRLRLVALISTRPCCVCELAAVLNLAQPTITRHLQKLTEAGFLEYERRGFFQIYRLCPADQKAKDLRALVIPSLLEDPEIMALLERFRHLNVGPAFLRECPSKPDEEKNGELET